MIHSVKKAFDILEYISNNGNMVRLNDVAQAMELNKTTVHNFLDTLKQMGYLEQDELSPRYRITSKIQCLHAPDISSEILKSELRPILQQITESTGESTYLAVQMGSFYRHELKSLPNRTLRITLNMGKEYEMGTTAIGKVFLANSEYLQIAQKKYKGETEYLDLKDELDTIRTNGYALDVQQYDPDLNCVAVPLFYQRKIIAVLCVSGPSYRFGQVQFHQAIDIITQALKNLTQYTIKISTKNHTPVNSTKAKRE